MSRNDSVAKFDEQVAAGYDEQWAKLAPLRDAQHLLIRSILAELPKAARILCVGAGTGAEIVYLAQIFPHWHFTAVEPSAAMLGVCRQRIEQHGFEARCAFHSGYLDSLKAAEPYDAAMSLLVSQFVLDREARIGFFRHIFERLRRGGLLVTADLAADMQSARDQGLVDLWLRVMKGAEVPSDMLERMREVYRREVAVLPPEEVAGIVASAGFEQPVAFFQAGLIHAWFARRTAS